MFGGTVNIMVGMKWRKRRTRGADSRNRHSRSLWFVAVCWSALSMPHAGWAQSASVPAGDCKQSMTGPAFMKLLNTIIEHGDLSDIGFISREFGTKFIPFGGESDSFAEPPVRQMIYNGNHALGDSAAVKLIVDKDVQNHNTSFASLDIFPAFAENLESDHFTHCLYLTQNQFLSFFGRQGFFAMGSSPPVTTDFSKTLNVSGKGNTKLRILFSASMGFYGPPERGTVVRVMIQQSH